MQPMQPVMQPMQPIMQPMVMQPMQPIMQSMIMQPMQPIMQPMQQVLRGVNTFLLKLNPNKPSAQFRRNKPEYLCRLQEKRPFEQ